MAFSYTCRNVDGVLTGAGNQRRRHMNGAGIKKNDPQGRLAIARSTGECRCSACGGAAKIPPAVPNSFTIFLRSSLTIAENTQ
jgi:hypothetical protein